MSRHDYFPFGEEVPPQQLSYNTHQYTGHERDKTTGLDYMLARYYGAAMGRFVSADPADKFAKSMRVPARWNRYSYALNNPLRFIDLNGEDEISFGSRRFEVFPGDVLVVRNAGNGLHTATYVGGGKPGQIMVVDNTSARNQNLKNHGPATTSKLPDNTGNKHKPNDLTAPVNGNANPYSPAAGATAIGVVPAKAPVSSETVVKAAEKTEMFHQDRDEKKQCSDFTEAVDEEAGTEIGVDGSQGPAAYAAAVDPSREITPKK